MDLPAGSPVLENTTSLLKRKRIWHGRSAFCLGIGLCLAVSAVSCRTDGLNTPEKEVPGTQGARIPNKSREMSETQIEKLLSAMDRREYQRALRILDGVSVVPGKTPGMDKIITLLAVHGHDPQQAWYYTQRILKENKEAELPLLTRKRMAVEPWPPAYPELPDRNISALQALYDDLWVGTWNGGFVRINLDTGSIKELEQSRESLAPRTVRTIDYQGESLWVGTYTGLYHYWLRDGSWRKISTQGHFSTERIQDIKSLEGDLMISTLGWGLWRLRDDTLTRIETAEGPGPFITLVRKFPGEPNQLLVGTMDRGAWIWNTGNNSWERILPSPDNINSIEVSGKQIWFGSYGGGVVLWDTETNRWEEYTRKRGQIRNDWILSSCQDKKRIYWGTFGGGLSVYHKERDQWYTIDLQGGLHSLEIAALESDGRRVFAGSLGRGVRIVYPERYEELILNY